MCDLIWTNEHFIKAHVAQKRDVLSGVPYLSWWVEELFDDDFDLIKKNRVESWRYLVTDQLLDVFLDLSTKFLVGADQKF